MNGQFRPPLRGPWELKLKSGNWRTATKGWSVQPWQTTTMELDFTLSISTFAATEIFSIETMLGNKLSDIKWFSWQKSFKTTKILVLIWRVKFNIQIRCFQWITSMKGILWLIFLTMLQGNQIEYFSVKYFFL